jgi:hypothetical protein
MKPSQSQSEISEKKSSKLICVSNFNRISRLNFDDWTENSEVSSTNIPVF